MKKPQPRHPCKNATLLVPLTGIVGEGHHRFSEYVEMRWIPDNWRPMLRECAAKARLPDDAPLMSHYLVIREIALSSGTQGEVSLQRAWRPANEALLRLRLQKRGDVGFSMVLVDTEGWLEEPEKSAPPGLVAIPFYRVWHRPHVSCAYSLDAAEADELRRIFAASWPQSLMKDTAFRQFFRAYHEPYSTDRFLDNVIGLESLLIGGSEEASGMTHKFKDRGSFLLTRAMGLRGLSADEFLHDLGTLYKARSKLVHSPSRQVKEDWDTREENKLIVLAETYLRTLLRFSLEHPWARDSSAVEAHKREAFHRYWATIGEPLPPLRKRLVLRCRTTKGQESFFIGTLSQEPQFPGVPAEFLLENGGRICVSNAGEPTLLVKEPGSRKTVAREQGWSEFRWMALDHPHAGGT